jgi:sugar lactone lactonase YvrE
MRSVGLAFVFAFGGTIFAGSAAHAQSALAPGELVEIYVSEPTNDSTEAVVATDPQTLARRVATPLVLPQNLQSLARDPIDGALLGVEAVDGYTLARVLRFDPHTGRPQVLSEGGGFDYVYTSRIAVAPDGSIYAIGVGTDPFSGFSIPCILRIDRTTGAQSDVSCGGLFDQPGSIALDASGALLVGDPLVHAIFRVDPATGAQSVVTSSDPQLAPIGLADDGRGTIWVVDGIYAAPQLVRVDVATGEQTVVAPLPLDAEHIAVGPAGTLVISTGADASWAHWIGRFDPSSLTFTLRLESNDAHCGAFVVEPDGNWLAAWNDWDGVRIGRIDPSRGEEAPVFGWLGPAGPFHVLVDAQRRLLVLEPSGSNGGRVVRIDPGTGVQQLVLETDHLAPQADPTQQREGLELALSAGGMLYYAELGPDLWTHIYRVEGPAALAPVATVPGAISGLAVEKSGSLVATIGHDSGYTDVVRIDPATGAERTIAQLPLYSLDLAVAATGDLLVGEAGQLFRIDPVSFEVTQVSSAHHSENELLLDGLGAAYLVGDTDTMRVDLTTGETEVLALHGAAIARSFCADGLDNDHDGLVDWPADAKCSAAADDGERIRACGLGAELAPLGVGLAVFARRRRRPSGASRKAR